MTRKLCVAIVLKAGEGPPSGVCRLVEALRQDPRFEVVLFAADVPQATKLPIAIASVLAVERAVLGFLRKRLRFSCALGALQPFGQFKELKRSPDVIVDFTGLDLVEACAASASFGMWRLDSYSAVAGLEAAFQGKRATPVNLLRYQGNGCPPETVAHTVYDTKTLAVMNSMYIQEKSVQLIERELARLVGGDAVPIGPVLSVTIPTVPRTRALGRYILIVFTDIAARGWRALKARLGLKPRMFTLRVGRGAWPDFDPLTSVEIAPGGNTYWADPFLFENEGDTFLFFEDYSYESKKGHIGVGKLDGTRFDLIGPAHTAVHHLSYPYVFRHGGDIFLLPETHQAGRIEIWRATDFPTGWELYSTALEGIRAVDSVLKEIDGTWWLFTNICRDSFNDHCSELHIYRTDGPALTQLEPHRLNPVVVGSDTARGGGRVFCHDGRWYRNSQDNSGGVYGYGLNFMEITALDLEHYSERRVRHITKDFMPGLIGCHHFDAMGGLFVIDVRKP